MDNNYTKTPLLDEILNRRKEYARKKLDIQLIVCGIIGLIMTFACIASISGFAEIIGCWILPAIFAGGFWVQYINALNTKKRIIDNLFQCSDAVLENNLQKSEQLDEFVYLSDEYVLDFKLGQAAKLSEVESVGKYMQMEVSGYCISIYQTQAKRKFILLSTRQLRAAAIEKIKEAVSHAKKKYDYYSDVQS